MATLARRAAAATIVYLSQRYPLPPIALERAVALDPTNPAICEPLGEFYLDVAQPQDVTQARELFERAIATAPNRYGGWMNLGRTYEASDATPEAIAAYERAAALAPSAWRPPWLLGNLYIRADRTPEAVNCLTQAAERNPEIAELAVRTTWAATGGDVNSSVRVAGERLAPRLTVLQLLLEAKRIDESLALWRTLAEEWPADSNVVARGRNISDALLDEGRGPESASVWETAYPDRRARVDTIRNAGFDEPIAPAVTPFEWNVSSSDGARVSVAAGRTGGACVRIDYALKEARAVSNVAQTVLVRPGAAYVLSFWATTTDLVSGGTPTFTVKDVAGLTTPAVSESMPNGTSPWTEYSVRFVGPRSGAVRLSFERTPCGGVCPIFGAVSIDDVSLR